jgi:hypothetical protein
VLGFIIGIIPGFGDVERQLGDCLAAADRARPAHTVFALTGAVRALAPFQPQRSARKARQATIVTAALAAKKARWEARSETMRRDLPRW